MGHSTQSIPFFDPNITIKPHTASKAKWIDKPVSIKQFAKGRPCSLESIDGGIELIVRVGNHPTIDFIQGPEI